MNAPKENIEPDFRQPEIGAPPVRHLLDVTLAKRCTISHELDTELSPAMGGWREADRSLTTD